MSSSLLPSGSPRRPLSAWRWAALLGFALLAPAALPAGGGELRPPDLRRRESRREPLLSEGGSLHCSPDHQAPVLTQLEQGVPLRVLRRWLTPNGRRWLQVEAASAAGRPARGWLPG
ncbi:MAG: SH3 domain-containing protein [Synechococcaceae cyanobacterium]|nr:SH3 domain-containing protein [Synechococcaceae cyanobacterium]